MANGRQLPPSIPLKGEKISKKPQRKSAFLYNINKPNKKQTHNKQQEQKDNAATGSYVPTHIPACSFPIFTIWCTVLFITVLHQKETPRNKSNKNLRPPQTCHLGSPLSLNLFLRFLLTFTPIPIIFLSLYQDLVSYDER